MGKRRDKQQICGDLVQICREYFIYFRKTRQSSNRYAESIRRVIREFSNYLEKAQTQLPDITISHVDGFLTAVTSHAPSYQRLRRSILRCFLRYLYNERNLLGQNLADLIAGPPMFAKANPPKFLRPHELRKLLDHLPYSNSFELRTYAMVHLAFFLGLRPCEISQITLDDISFSKAQLNLKNRKNNYPLQLPIPENALKALTAYIVGARPQSQHRSLFLLLTPPHWPISPALVARYLARALRSAGIPGTAYWLRHTYAQNLLEAGSSIYEVKEMMGHSNIESTRRYLHVHTRLMRKVLFDEIL